MAVYWEVSSAAPILSGHWVCPRSIMTNSCCLRPREVTKVSASNVYWNDDRGHGHCGKNSIVFFADSEEEAQAVYELEKAKHQAIDDAKERITAEFDAKIAEILDRGIG